ncbi:MAG: histidine kinase [Gammaproteobacteria bacterium]|nr:histidine kinase [Gammaproteobacteria bacterium]
MNMRQMSSDKDLDLQHLYLMIARDLHDEIGQELTTIKLMANQASISSDLALIQSYADKISKSIDITQASFRKLLTQIKHPNSQTSYSIDDIHSLIKKWQTINNVCVLWSIEGAFDQLNTTYLHTLYHLIQESLTNISRHANAKTVHINLVCTHSFISLQINDDGIGFKHQDTFKKGFGLSGMTERVQELNGQISCTSDHGTRIDIVFTL